MSKKEKWLDQDGELNTWDQLIDAVLVQNKINAALSQLLYRHKVSVREVANACYQARAEYYGYKKENKIKHTIVSEKAQAKGQAKTKENEKKAPRKNAAAAKTKKMAVTKTVKKVR